MSIGYSDDLNSILGGMGENAFDRLTRIISPFYYQGQDTEHGGYNGGGTRPGTPLDLSTLGNLFNQNRDSFNDAQAGWIGQILQRGSGGGGTGDNDNPDGYDWQFSQALQNYFNQLGSGGQGASDRLMNILQGLGGRKSVQGIFQGSPEVGLEQLQALVSGRGVNDQPIIGHVGRANFLERIIAALSGGGGGDDDGGGGDGGGGGGGGGGGNGGNGGYGGNGGNGGGGINHDEDPFIQMMRDWIQGRMEGDYGIPREVLDDNRASLQGMASQREQAAMQQAQQMMNARGQLGGGRQMAMNRDISDQVGDMLGQSILGLETNAAQMAVQDRQAAVNEALNFTNFLGGQDLGHHSLNLQDMLGRMDINLRGQLGNRQLDLSEAGFMFDSRLQEWIMDRFYGTGGR